MNTPIKLLLAVLVLAAAGLTYMMLQRDDPVLKPEQNDPSIQDPEVEKPAKSMKASTPDPKRVKTGTPERVETPEVTTASGSEYEQGVSGVIVDPANNPVAGAKLYLMPGLGFNSLRMFEQYQKGERYPPVAATETGPDGRFRLGVKVVNEDKKYEIRILHEAHCDKNLTNIAPQPKDWTDLGQIKLKVGATIFGRVTNENGLPVADAQVLIRDGSGSLNITPAPGREDGLIAITSPSGDYELNNVDPDLIHRAVVSAANFANEEKADINLKGETRHQLDFQLAVGMNIGGTVVNPKGEPIPGAKVTVAALSQRSQQTVVNTTDREGTFLAEGLKPGVYAVIVEAKDYLNADEKPIQAGQTDLTITLEQTGRVRVTVLDKNGAPMRKFHCNLKAAFEGQDTYGNPIVSKSVKNAKEGSVEIQGVKPMTYVAEIFAAGHAKNFSERFTISEGQIGVPEVTVKLNEGGIIAGIVVDTAGKPVPNVQIKTMPNGMVENPFTRMFQVAYTITNQTTKSGPDGKFRFNQLYSGKYQLKFDHAEFCSLVLPDIGVQVGETSDLAQVSISRGCMVSGIAYVGNKAEGQVRVNVSSIQDPKNPTPAFSCEAITDNEGKFLLPKRLPAGDYNVMAAQNIQANPLIMMVQFNKSKKKFTISEGVETHSLDIRLQEINNK